MNTIEIAHLLKSHHITNKFFKGVFPCNQLPRKIKKPACIIANTDPAHKSGTHWVAFYFPRKGPAEYFDSYGKYPNNSFFQKFLLTNSNMFVCNKQRLQGTLSQVCGHYCCVYLYFRCKGQSLKKFLKQFSLKNYELNDKEIMNLYCKIYLKNGGIYCNQSCTKETCNINSVIQ